MHILAFYVIHYLSVGPSVWLAQWVSCWKVAQVLDIIRVVAMVIG